MVFSFKKWLNFQISFFKQQTKKHSLVKFLFVFFIFLIYAIFVSSVHGLEHGFLITILTWSCFVFCTPIAAAGFMLDFPIRLITGIKMVYSEAMIWGLAFALNFFAVFFIPEIYSKTIILSLFYHIIFHPFPFWSIILISGVGTFLSIYFGDELMDVSKHSDRKEFHAHMTKHQIIIFIFIILLVLSLYNFLLSELGVNLFN